MSEEEYGVFEGRDIYEKFVSIPTGKAYWIGKDSPTIFWTIDEFIKDQLADATIYKKEFIGKDKSEKDKYRLLYYYD